jgi:hypothetical protein
MTVYCETLIAAGASAIGQLSDGHVQNDVGLGNYAARSGAVRAMAASFDSHLAQSRRTHSSAA